MKNLKVSQKLIISFVAVVLMAILVGVIGIVGMNKISVADRGLYDGNYLPTVMAGDISQIIVKQRMDTRSIVIFDVNLDADTFSSAEKDLAQTKTDMERLLAEYKDTITEQDDRDAYDEFVKVYNDEWLPAVKKIHDFGLANQTDEAKAALVAAAPTANKLDELTTKLQQINLDAGEASVEGNTTLFNTMTAIEVAVLIGAIIVSFFFAFYISSLISKPTTFMKDILRRIGVEGDLLFSDAEYKLTEQYADCKDEIGQSVDMMLTMVRRLVKVGGALETVAGGDLTAELSLLSDRDTMGVSLQKMVGNLNDMFGEINNSTAQVSAGSKQIADGAQALAQGSTQQAAAVEQLSASISEVAGKTKENAEMATKAASLAETIKGNAEKGSRQMDTMMGAVKDINDASQSINKVIKVIDDIAFQTNILALNAAVEAARAGQHGKGFAVVAEEVRSLAAKSAEAAKDTGALIANSMEKAELGARIADETAASLTEIVSGINESTKIVSEIARSSEEQSTAITQINNGIDQVAQVVQQNSATAEESAAASEEMSGQSSMLEELISQFKLKDQNRRPTLSTAPVAKSSKRLTMPVKAVPSSHSEGFGKY